MISNYDDGTIQVDEELPLKQGLKLGFITYLGTIDIVDEELPLKQGLKHNCVLKIRYPLFR